MAPKAIKFKQTKSGRMGKDPSRPKKPLTSYLAFMKDKRPQLAAKHPGLSVGQLAPKVAAAWKGLNDKEKNKYEKEAAKDKARFDREMLKYTPSAEYLAAKDHYAARKKLAKSSGGDVAGLPPLLSEADIAELAELRKKCAQQQKELERKDKKIEDLEGKLEKQKEKAAAAKEKAAESKAAKAAAKASKAAAKAAKPAKAAAPKPAAKAAAVTGSKRKAPDSKPKYEAWVKEQMANPSAALKKALKGGQSAVAKLLEKKFKADFK